MRMLHVAADGSAIVQTVDFSRPSLTTWRHSGASLRRTRSPIYTGTVNIDAIWRNAHEMAVASGFEFLLNAAALPLLPHSLELALLRLAPSGSCTNPLGGDTVCLICFVR
jgi:hypothetical protein